MKYNVLCFLLSFAMVFCSCSRDDEPVNKARTVLVYMVAQNSLSGFASKDYEEMKQGMQEVDPASCNLLVYIDDNFAPRLLHLTKDKKGQVVEEVVKEFGEQNSLDISVMKGLLSDAFQRYPAESYGLVLWSHGEGWLPKSMMRWWGQDGDDYMDISELHEVLQSIPHLDFLFFDACFMESVEVAYELRDCMDYLIGSPTEIPGPGAPYQLVAPAFFVKENAGLAIATAYYEYYNGLYKGGAGLSNSNWTAGASVAVLKCSELEHLASATAKVLPKYIQNKQDIAVSGVMCYDKRYMQYYYDLERFIYKLTGGNSDYTEWKSAFDAAVIYWKTTPKNFSGLVQSMFAMDLDAGGVSGYVPRSSMASVNAFYQNLAWYKVAGWSQTGW
ncbi:clostripain-related cysteine peptidase [Parabacteroides chinchillae]|uniref:Clostripain n=1 Tax=Parabacteroides chinchillae TaxID=871327 RepID=A0A8G2BY46_9BACT|nr:clostripain-related cysteine peptidase [Parabacteroides chinchillae]SEG14154.1 hypothetical protein SAMN05444001_11675 [Parabacteroides chinchillae]